MPITVSKQALAEAKARKDLPEIKVLSRKADPIKALTGNQVRPMARESEDEFAQFYLGTQGGTSGTVLQPTYSVLALERLVQKNATLGPCIEAMVNNIDGTGFTIEPAPGSEAERKQQERKAKLRQRARGVDPLGFDGPDETQDDEGDGEGEDKGGEGKPPFPPKKKPAFKAFPSPMDGPKQMTDPKKPGSAINGTAKPGAGHNGGPPLDDEDPAYDLDQPEEKDPKQQALEDFFNEPFPGMSFTTLRRKVRWDIEAIGFGTMEALRTLDNKLVGLRYVEAKTIRLVRYDDAIPKDVTLKRDGKDKTLSVWVRERRYCQVMYNDLVYFKEFGSKRNLDRITGRWETPENLVPPERRATEILYFGCKKDPDTPYHIPRWLPQTPSVLGSRKAEEFNLGFFDSGGIPPLAIFVEGGTMAEEAQKAMEDYFEAKGPKHLPLVMHAISTSGSMDKPSQVKVKVERFGTERQQDSMFETYGANCDKRIRSSFRLPAILVGKSEEANYATAIAAYSSAEAQVFKPERDDFDEKINLQVMPELDDSGDWNFRSKPMSVSDATNQLKALELANGSSAIDHVELVEKLNEVTSLEMTPSIKAPLSPAEQAQQQFEAAQNPMQPMSFGGAANGKPGGKPPSPNVGSPIPSQQGIRKGDQHVHALAVEMVEALDGGLSANGSRLVDLVKMAQELGPEDYELLTKSMTLLRHGADDMPKGFGDLMGCATYMLAQHLPR